MKLSNCHSEAERSKIDSISRVTDNSISRKLNLVII